MHTARACSRANLWLILAKAQRSQSRWVLQGLVSGRENKHSKLEAHLCTSNREAWPKGGKPRLVYHSDAMIPTSCLMLLQVVLEASRFTDVKDMFLLARIRGEEFGVGFRIVLYVI